MEPSEISPKWKIAVGTHFHGQHETKTTPVFVPADGEASQSLCPSSIFSLPISSNKVQSENTYSCAIKVKGQVWENKKQDTSKLITATTSIHLPKSVSTDLTMKSDSILTNQI